MCILKLGGIWFVEREKREEEEVEQKIKEKMKGNYSFP